MKKILFFFSLFAALFFITACDNSSMESLNVNAKSPEDDYLLHALSSEKLRKIMQDIRSAIEREDEATLFDEKLSEDQMADIVEAVEELLFHAELLSIGKPGVELDENELVTFRAMASQLYTEVLNLKQVTEYYDYHLLEPAYERLSQTCVACHSLFRDDNN